MDLNFSRHDSALAVCTRSSGSYQRGSDDRHSACTRPLQIHAAEGLEDVGPPLAGLASARGSGPAMALGSRLCGKLPVPRAGAGTRTLG